MDRILMTLLEVAERVGPYGIVVAAFLWIRFNHLEHVASDVRELRGRVDGIEKTFVEMREDIAFIKGRMNGGLKP